MYWIFEICGEIKRAQSCRKFAIDGPFDWLNRILMPTLMVICCFLQTFTFIFGTNISCVGFDRDDKSFAEEYCWTQGIYTNKAAYNMPQHAPYPGISPCVPAIIPKTGKIWLPCSDEETDKAYHLWYQWVPFYFLAVALGYYIPFLILKGSKLHQVKPLITYLLDHDNLEGDPKDLVGKLSHWVFKQLVYPRFASTSSLSMLWHEWGLVLLVCSVKVLYLTTSLLHMVLTARMFKIGNWFTYGIQFARRATKNTTHVKDIVFPKMVACRIVQWGATGKVPTTGMCVLALNVMNQYLFLIVWYMNVLLIFLNFFSCAYTILKFCSPNIVHHRIVNSSSLLDDHDFTRMFGYVGPSGRIILAKMSEHMPGYLLTLIARKVTNKIDKENIKNKGQAPKIKFTKVNGQPSEIARGPLMELNTMMFSMVPQNIPESGRRTGRTSEWESEPSYLS